MNTLAITRGLPGSGKTTMAREWVAEAPSSRARVNRDDLRASLFGREGVLDFATEQTITRVQHATVRALLDSGHDVVVDDTNLRLRYARAWADVALEAGAAFEVWELDADVDTCIERDAARDRSLGADTIRAIAARFHGPRLPVTPSERKADAGPLPYTPRLGCPQAWLVDVDGTLALMGDRSPYDTTRVHEDTPNHAIIELVRSLSDSFFKIVVMSGRDESCRDSTLAWLKKHLGERHFSSLLMRPEGDRRKDFIVKGELFDAHVRNEWNVVGVLDDRKQVVDMWRSIGLTCLQVAPGDF